MTDPARLERAAAELRNAAHEAPDLARPWVECVPAIVGGRLARDLEQLADDALLTLRAVARELLAVADWCETEAELRRVVEASPDHW